MYSWKHSTRREPEPRQSLGEATLKPPGSCSHRDKGGFKQAFLVDISHRNNMESFRKNACKIRTKMVYRVKFS